MYLIEIIVKFFLKKRRKNYVQYKENNEDEIIDYDCVHVYYPIDSSKEYLACSKCGHIVKNSKQNPFSG